MGAQGQDRGPVGRRGAAGPAARPPRLRPGGDGAGVIGVAEIFRDFGLSSAAVQAKNLCRRSAATCSGSTPRRPRAHRGRLLLRRRDRGVPRPALRGWRRRSRDFLLNGLSTQFRADLNRAAFKSAGGDRGRRAADRADGRADPGRQRHLGAGGAAADHAAVMLTAMPRPPAGSRPAGPAAPMGGLLNFGGTLAVAVDRLPRQQRRLAPHRHPVRRGPAGPVQPRLPVAEMPLAQLRAPTTTVALPVLSRLQGDRRAIRRSCCADRPR